MYNQRKKQGGPSSLNVTGSVFCTQGKMLQTLPKGYVISCTCAMLWTAGNQNSRQLQNNIC